MPGNGASEDPDRDAVTPDDMLNPDNIEHQENERTATNKAWCNGLMTELSPLQVYKGRPSNVRNPEDYITAPTFTKFSKLVFYYCWVRKKRCIRLQSYV
ncbi:hypothetical protein MRX96_023794 [Rhipicephalus microplus]